MHYSDIRTAHLPEIHVLVDMIKSGKTVLRVAIEYGVSETTILNRLKRAGYKIKKTWKIVQDEKYKVN